MMKLTRSVAQTFVLTSLLALFAAGGSSAFAEEVPVTPDVGPPSEKSAPRTGEHGVRSLDLNDPAAGTGKGNEPPPGKEAAPTEAPAAPGLRERYRAARKGNQGDPGCESPLGGKLRSVQGAAVKVHA